MNRNQVLGYVGAGLMAVGVFMPVLSLPIVGSVNYFDNGKGYGVGLLVIALLAVAVVSLRKFKLMWILGLSSMAFLVYTLIRVLNEIENVKSQMIQELDGNPFAGLAEGLLDTIQVQWGWAVLFLSSVLMLLSAGLPAPDPQSAFVETETLERMQVWISLGKPKSEFGDMSAKESELYDRISQEITTIKTKGGTVEIVSETP